jgi:two-component sensor histidine kinase
LSSHFTLSFIFCIFFFSVSKGNALTIKEQVQQNLHWIQEGNLPNDSVFKLIDENELLLHNSKDSRLITLGLENQLEKSFMLYKKSLYKEALTLALAIKDDIEATKDTNLIHSCYLRLGNYYAKLGSKVSDLGSDKEQEMYMELAKKFYNKSLQLAQNFGDRILILNSFIGIDNYFMGSNQMDSAEYYGKLIISQCVERDYKEKAAAFNILGVVYFEKGNFSLAEENFKTSIINAEQLNRSLILLSAKGNLANVYYKQGKFSAAKKELHELIELNKEEGRKQNISKNYITLHKIFKEENKLDSALYAYEMYYLYRDSIVDEDHQAIISELSIQYETKEKEQQLSLIKQEQELSKLSLKNQRKSIIFLSIILFLTLISAILFISNQKRMNEMKQVQLRSQLARSQFNPHFINNAFFMLQAEVIDKFYDENLINRLAKVAQFSRQMLESSFKEEWSLKEELDFIQNYIDLQKEGKKSKLAYIITLDEYLEEKKASLLVPSAICQILAENAIDHGFDENLKDGFLIEFSVSLSDFVIIEIKNTMKVIQDSTIKKREAYQESRGLSLIKKRLEVHSKIYHQGSSLESKVQNNQFIVTLKLPIIYDKSSHS